MAATVDLSKVASAVRIDAPVMSTLGLGALAVEPLSALLVASATEFRIGVPSESEVSIEVTDEAGRCVCSARMRMPAGWQKVAFSGHDTHGALLPNGTYQYTVVAGNSVQTARIMIAR